MTPAQKNIRQLRWVWDVKIGDFYDEPGEQRFVDALLQVFELARASFEYPDWSHKTVGQCVEDVADATDIDADLYVRLFVFERGGCGHAVLVCPRCVERYRGEAPSYYRVVASTPWVEPCDVCGAVGAREKK